VEAYLRTKGYSAEDAHKRALEIENALRARVVTQETEKVITQFMKDHSLTVYYGNEDYNVIPPIIENTEVNKLENIVFHYLLGDLREDHFVTIYTDYGNPLKIDIYDYLRGNKVVLASFCPPESCPGSEGINTDLVILSPYPSDKDIDSLKSKYEPAAMVVRLNQVIFERAAAMAKAAVERKDSSQKEAADKALDKAVDALNARAVVKMVESQQLSVAPTTPFIEASQEKEKAIEALLKGQLVTQMPIAGEGNRMYDSLVKLGKAVNIDEVNYIEINDKRIARDRLKLANIDIWEIAQVMGLIPSIPALALRLGFGTRQILALQQGILDLKKLTLKDGRKLTNEDVLRIARNLKLIVSVSDNIEKDIQNLFLGESILTGRPFFEFFNPENVVFVNGGYGKGFEFNDKGVLVPSNNPNLAKLSWNHGYAFTELAWIKGPYAYTLTGERSTTGEPITISLDVPVFKYVYNRGARYGVIRRINDLLLLHPTTSMDVQMFGAFLNIISKDSTINAYFEMMANPTGQKGGLALSLDGKHLTLIETLTTKDGRIVSQKEGDPDGLFDILTKEELARTGGKRGIPYNRLYGYYVIADLVRVLTQEDLPLAIKYKAGIISPEIPTGDITWLKGVHALATVRGHDLFIDKGIVPNEQRDAKNNAIKDAQGNPKAAYEPGLGSIIHDCKAAIYIKDGYEVVKYLDNVDQNVFEPTYYSRVTSGNNANLHYSQR